MLPSITSTLRICPQNPRYFCGADDKAVFLTGSHTWNNLIDMGPKNALVSFDFPAYLDLLTQWNHNFIRLWAWDFLGTWNPKDDVLQFPWKRTGPGLALDGRPKFDLTQFAESYFARLKERVALALAKNIYVSVMLFDSWANFQREFPPLNRCVFALENNINQLDILQTLDKKFLMGWCTPNFPDFLAIQKAYVEKVVRILNEFDNVLYEISNEPGPFSHDWQEHLTGFIRQVESTLPKKHPIGQTGGMRCSSEKLHASCADYLATEYWPIDRNLSGYKTAHYTWGSAPDDKADRPIFLDTDHLWGIGGDALWAWKSFTRGYNILYMDRWDDQPSGFYHHRDWEGKASQAVRRELGVMLEFSQRIDLTRSAPANHLASTHDCLAVPGKQYVAVATGGAISLELPAGQWLLTWHNINTGQSHNPEPKKTPGPGTHEFLPPSADPHALLLTQPDPEI